MFQLNNLSDPEILFSEFIKWELFYNYAFIYDGELYRFSECGEKVYSISTGTEFATHFFCCRRVLPVEIVKIDYILVDH